MKSLFESVELAPRDPILGLNEQYNADTRAGKVNLGVGVYYDDEGRIPLLDAVSKAETARIEAHAARGYLHLEALPRSEERRVGNECGSQCSSRWSRDHYKKNISIIT